MRLNIAVGLIALQPMIRSASGRPAGIIVAASNRSASGAQVSPRELGKLVERVDLNGDGAINFDEFAASLVDWQQVSMHPDLLLPS